MKINAKIKKNAAKAYNNKIVNTTLWTIAAPVAVPVIAFLFVKHLKED